MALVRLEISSRMPFADGAEFGATGALERIDGVAHYAVDPTHEANAGIVDLALAERDESGLVRFRGDATFVVPVDPPKGNRAVLCEVPNRGFRFAPLFLHGAVPDMTDAAGELGDIATLIAAGDGLFYRRGWSMAWCGWQWDVPRSHTQPSGRMGLDAPLVPEAKLGDRGTMQLRIQPVASTASVPLTDQHTAAAGMALQHLPIAPADLEDPAARLLVRDGAYGDAAELPRGAWRFARDQGGKPVEDAGWVWLDGGFEAGRIYDLIYRPAECRVVGAGLLALRDFAAFLKRDQADNPLAGHVDHVIGVGVSQTGRLPRHFLSLGLNVDEAGAQAFDGVLAHIGGGRRGEFNHRYAQPSVQPTPSFGHLFPFADDPQTDPATGAIAGLLDRQRERGGVPRIFQTDSSSEYWRGDASLTHSDAATGADVEPPEEVRRYLFASTEHSSLSVSGGGNPRNRIDSSPLVRAALANLLDWVRGIEPPPSVFPRRRDGTAKSREEVIEKLAKLGTLVLPDRAKLPRVVPLDLGPTAASGAGTFPARVIGEPYSCFVSDVDECGNETGGIRLPEIEVAVATHTGFNPRPDDAGAAGEILEYAGSRVALPQSFLSERYASREAYVAAVRAAAETLVANRYVLEEDAERCVEIAVRRYDAALA